LCEATRRAVFGLPFLSFTERAASESRGAADEMRADIQPLNWAHWSSAKAVVFDLDGTLLDRRHSFE